MSPVTANSALSNTINALKIKMSQLEEELASFRIIFDELPGSVYLKDTKGVYRLINRVSKEQLVNVHGIHDDIVGKTDFDIFPEESARIYQLNDKRVLEKGESIVEEEEIILHNGRRLIQLSSKRPLSKETGEVVGILGTTIDITEKKKIELELKQAKEKAEASSLAKSEFIQNISHDLRTPLTGLVTISESYAKTSHDDTLKEIFSLMRDSSNQLHQFLEKIIESVKLDNYSEIPEKLTSFSIEETVKRVMNLYKPAIVSKSMAYSIQPIENEKMIETKLMGYPDLIDRILMNLVGNAVKFTSSGSVTVSYGLESHNINQQNTHNLVLMIRDTGKGIPTSKHQAIFERLTRLSPSYKGIYEGYGLGLYVTKKLMTLMNGHITVESDGIEGKGSTFTCRIPVELSNEKLIRCVTNSIDIIENQASYHILLADDSRVARCGAKITLQNTVPNCTVTEVGTLQEIITCIESTQYDLIITDLKFSDGDSKIVAQQIRELTTSKNQTTPIVALTGDTRKSTEESCIACGMNKVLHKPLTLNVVSRLINEFLPDA